MLVTFHLSQSCLSELSLPTMWLFFFFFFFLRSPAISLAGMWHITYVARDKRPMCCTWFALNWKCPQRRIEPATLWPLELTYVARDKRLMCCTWFAHHCALTTRTYMLETSLLQWGDLKISNCAFECDHYYYYLIIIIIIIIIKLSVNQFFVLWSCLHCTKDVRDGLSLVHYHDVVHFYAVFAFGRGRNVKLFS